MHMGKSGLRRTRDPSAQDWDLGIRGKCVSKCRHALFRAVGRVANSTRVATDLKIPRGWLRRREIHGCGCDESCAPQCLGSERGSQDPMIDTPLFRQDIL